MFHIFLKISLTAERAVRIRATRTSHLYPKHLTDYIYTWNTPKKERHAKHNSLACPLLHFVAISAGRSINSLQNRSITVASKPKRPSLFFGRPIFARVRPPRANEPEREHRGGIFGTRSGRRWPCICNCYAKMHNHSLDRVHSGKKATKRDRVARGGAGRVPREFARRGTTREWLENVRKNSRHSERTAVTFSVLDSVCFSQHHPSLQMSFPVRVSPQLFGIKIQHENSTGLMSKDNNFRIIQINFQIE